MRLLSLPQNWQRVELSPKDATQARVSVQQFWQPGSPQSLPQSPVPPWRPPSLPFHRLPLPAGKAITVPMVFPTARKTLTVWSAIFHGMIYLLTHVENSRACRCGDCTILICSCDDYRRLQNDRRVRFPLNNDYRFRLESSLLLPQPLSVDRFFLRNTDYSCEILRYDPSPSSSTTPPSVAQPAALPHL